MPGKKDLTGQKFGRWLVIEQGPHVDVHDGKDIIKRIQWWCRCECGTRKLVMGTSLRNGLSQSCGCIRGRADYKSGGKICSKCKRWKPLGLYNYQGNGPNKRRSECKMCLSVRLRARDHGLSQERVRELLNDGHCQICGTNTNYPLSSIHFDHDHATGKFRGILCSACNHGLGMFRDDTETLRKAIDYLERS